jgi:hypothetical protein
MKTYDYAVVVVSSESEAVGNLNRRGQIIDVCGHPIDVLKADEGAVGGGVGGRQGGTEGGHVHRSWEGCREPPADVHLVDVAGGDGLTDDGDGLDVRLPIEARRP